MKKNVSFILTGFLLLVTSCTHAMEQEKQAMKKECILAPVAMSPYILGIPTFFEMLPAELRKLLVVTLLKNNPELAKCYSFGLQGNPGPFEWIINIGGHRILTCFKPKKNEMRGKVQMWDITDGRCIATLDEHHTAKPLPVIDTQATKIATFGLPNITIWNARDGSRITELPDTFSATNCVFNQQGAILLTESSCTKTIKAWNTTTGNLLWSLEDQNMPCFNKTGDKIVSITTDGVCQIFDARTGVKQCMLQNAVEGKIKWVAFNRDDTLIVAQGLNNNIGVYSTATGLRLIAMEARRSIDKLTAGDIILTNGWQFYDLQGNHLEYNDEILNRQRFSPLGTMLAIPCRNGNVKILNTSNREILHVLQGHADIVDHILWNRQESTLITISNDKDLRVWNLKNGECILHIKCAAINDAVFNPAGDKIIVVFTKRIKYKESAHIKIFNINGHCIIERDLPGSPGAFNPEKVPDSENSMVSFNHDGSLFFILCKNGYYEKSSDGSFVHIFKSDDPPLADCIYALEKPKDIAK